MKKTLLKIRQSQRLPSYGDLMFCVDKLLNEELSELDELNMREIIKRASIKCFDFNKFPTREEIKKRSLK